MLPLSGVTIAKAEEEEVPKGATMVSSSPLLTMFNAPGCDIDSIHLVRYSWSRMQAGRTRRALRSISEPMPSIIAHQQHFLNHLTELKASALANVGGVFLRGADREGVQKLVPPTAYFCDNTFLEHPVPTRCGAPGFKTETLLVGMNS